MEADKKKEAEVVTKGKKMEIFEFLSLSFFLKLEIFEIFGFSEIQIVWTLS